MFLIITSGVQEIIIISPILKLTSRDWGMYNNVDNVVIIAKQGLYDLCMVAEEPKPYANKNY